MKNDISAAEARKRVEEKKKKEKDDKKLREKNRRKEIRKYLGKDYLKSFLAFVPELDDQMPKIFRKIEEASNKKRIHLSMEIKTKTRDDYTRIDWYGRAEDIYTEVLAKEIKRRLENLGYKVELGRPELQRYHFTSDDPDMGSGCTFYRYYFSVPIKIKWDKSSK